MSEYDILHTSRKPKNLKISLQDDSIVLNEFRLEDIIEEYRYPRYTYEDTKKYFFNLGIDTWFCRSYRKNILKWIANELQCGNKISYMLQWEVNSIDKEAEQKERQEYNSIYKKEFLSIKEVMSNPEIMENCDFNIEYEFIL